MQRKLPKPKWCPWEAASWASDPKVKLLSFHWRGVYFDLLNSLMLDGELEWRQMAFEMAYRNPAAPDETEPMLAELRRFFDFRDEDGREFFSHSKVNEGRERYFRAIRQRSKAGKGNKGKRKPSATTVKRPSDDRRTEAERRPSPSLSPSPSGSGSGSGSEDPTNTVDSKKAARWHAGLAWVQGLPERDQQHVAYAIETVKRTRKTGEVAESVVKEILFQLSRFPDTAIEACATYVNDHPEKSEKYLIGIARSMANEKNGLPRSRP